MLTFEEEETVTEVLMRLIHSTGDPYGTLAVAMEPRLTSQFNASGVPLIIVMKAIQLCINDGYTSTPPALVRLLRLVRALDPRIPPLMERLSQPPLAGQRPADPFSDELLFTNAPFLERAATRTALKALLQMNPAQPFVVVNGLSKLGKTYTTDFISHVLRNRPNLMPCFISLPPKCGAAVGPIELARGLVSRMGGDLATVPPKNTNLDRWYEELVSWITAPGIRDGITWWIVLDGFNAAELRDDTRPLIGKLAARLTNAMPQRLFRLILLDFDHTALPVTPGLIRVDVIQPIPKASVSTFLTGIFHGAEEISVPALHSKITGGLSEPIVELPELAQRLGSVIRAATI